MFFSITSSVAIKKEAFVNFILDILNVMDLPMWAISTDGLTRNKKTDENRQKFQDILHQFDPWHIRKNLLKKFMKASQKKGYKSFHISFSPKRAI